MLKSQKYSYPTKIDSKGIIRVYDPKTNTFGAYCPDGRTKIFYKPDVSVHGHSSNEAYWNAQIGEISWTPYRINIVQLVDII